MMSRRLVVIQIMVCGGTQGNACENAFGKLFRNRMMEARASRPPEPGRLGQWSQAGLPLALCAPPADSGRNSGGDPCTGHSGFLVECWGRGDGWCLEASQKPIAELRTIGWTTPAQPGSHVPVLASSIPKQAPGEFLLKFCVFSNGFLNTTDPDGVPQIFASNMTAEPSDKQSTSAISVTSHPGTAHTITIITTWFRDTPGYALISIQTNGSPAKRPKSTTKDRPRPGQGCRAAVGGEQRAGRQAHSRAQAAAANHQHKRTARAIRLHPSQPSSSDRETASRLPYTT